MTIAAILDEKGADVVSVSAADSVADVVRILADRRIGAVPVIDGGRVAGIFSERDVVDGLAREGAALLGRAVGDVMTAPAITVARDVQVLAALSMMTRRRVRHLPVVESGELAGVVSIGDLVKHRIDRIESEAEAMREYIQSA